MNRKDRLYALTQRLRSECGREFSAGVSAWGPGESPAPVLERADAALYQAKRNGRNQARPCPTQAELSA